MSSPSQPTSSYNDPPPYKEPVKSRIKAFFNFSYFKTLHFVLKVLLIIMQTCGAISASVKYSSWGSTQYYDFVAVSGIVIIIIIILLHFFPVTTKLSRVPWNLIELIFDAVWAILILIASAIITDSAKRYAYMESYAAAAFFGFATLVLYLVDAFLRLFGFIRGSKSKAAETAQPPAAPTTVDENPPTFKSAYQ